MTEENQTSSPVSEKPFRKSNRLIKLIFFILGLFLIGSGGYYVLSKYYISKRAAQTVNKNEINKADYPRTTVLASEFAAFEETPVNINPRIPKYEVDKDLKNITNLSDFQLSDPAKDLLIKNAFAVVPAKHEEFYSIYENNRYQQIPNFITTDSMLHNYHLVFDHLLKKLEEEKLIPILKTLVTDMQKASQEQYDKLSGSEWENAAKRNIGFFNVAGILLDPNTKIPATVKSEVEKELTLIESHSQISESEVMNIGLKEDTVIQTPQGSLPLEALKEDYTQYVPRGHYEKSDQLKAYFKAMMWLGRLTFRLKSVDEIRSSVLITLNLNNQVNNQNWNSLYEPINFFVGKSDDITYYQLRDVLKKIYGQDATINEVLTDKEKFSLLIDEMDKLAPPQINSMPIFQASIQTDREKEIKGFRFMGQRFTVDASIFQRLVYREVGDKTRSCPDFKPAETGCLDGARCLPKGLDIPAAMGSAEALKILTANGETEYACYPENMQKMKDYISGLQSNVWTQNLYWGWLYSLRPLTVEKKEGYPTFMQNIAFLRKELNTYLASWTELKRDTILYAKQVYAEMGAGGEQEKDYRGYVEPNPHVYGRLASLIAMTGKGLETRGLLSDKNKETLSNLEKLALSLKTISEKELNMTDLTADENNLIKSYGGQLENIWFEIFHEDYPRPILDDNSNAPVVADVATDPNGQVLEEGTGYIWEIYAAVPIDGKLRLAKGGVYSYYEFPQPMNDRLTDSKWKEILRSGKNPPPPVWTKEFHE